MPDAKEQFRRYTRTDPVPEFRAAGLNTVQPGDQSVHKALQPDPPTQKTAPEHFKYSDQLKFEPGRIQVHHGVFGSDLGPQDAPYGRPNECRADASKVHQMLNPPVASRFEDAMEKDKCKLYHSSIRETMGRSYNHGLTVPDYAKEPDHRFGCFSDRNEWGSKELVCPAPDPDEDNPEHKRMYTLSHAAYGVGEQRSRNYDWDKIGVKPGEFKFGVVDANRGQGGVENALKGDAAKEKRCATIVQKTVTDFKAFNQDQLGKVKHTGAGLHGLADEHAFGMSTVKTASEWGTKECMEGNKTIEEQMPDADLGRSLQPGWRNTTNTDRAFGVPNVRTDRPVPQIRSVADDQNYGDEANAKELLYPSTHAWKGVSLDDFYQPRGFDELFSVMQCSGFDLSEEQANQVYNEAANGHPDGLVSLESFRYAMLDTDQAFPIKG
eukprot:TRINITY_DN3889_c0_g1_i1.p1 TRINITY_DN3889_c0_g1~~TRINITY_DN3889_c0_g1_i1.p1  ORF type:complete len:437 (-),score=104.55 TRINITY_DN3889_c0_g1_i1:229-1539(-)